MNTEVGSRGVEATWTEGKCVEGSWGIVVVWCTVGSTILWTAGVFVCTATVAVWWLSGIEVSWGSDGIVETRCTVGIVVWWIFGVTVLAGMVVLWIGVTVFGVVGVKTAVFEVL